MSEEKKYEQTFQELKNIMSALERNEFSVEELSGAVKRAAELTEICRAKLDKAEKDIRQVMGKFNETPPADETSE
jgi:exodeoxyribonuclease VII small subunit